MTSNRGAGFSSAPRKFDPLGGAPGRSPLLAAPGGAPGSLLPKKAEASNEEVARDMERRVHALLEESALAHAGGDSQQGAARSTGCLRLPCTACVLGCARVAHTHSESLLRASNTTRSHILTCLHTCQPRSPGEGA